MSDLDPLVSIQQKGDGFYWFKDNVYPDDQPEVVLVAHDFNGRMIMRVGKLLPVPIDPALSDWPNALIGVSSLPPPVYEEPPPEPPTTVDPPQPVDPSPISPIDIVDGKPHKPKKK